MVPPAAKAHANPSPTATAVPVIGVPWKVTATSDWVPAHTRTLPGVTVPPGAVTVYQPAGTVNLVVALALCSKPSPTTV